jgi:pimeloyl-ACP methyl ester carboxylesterase
MSGRFSARRLLPLALIAGLLCLAVGRAEARLGVVLLHGKMGGPRVFQGLAEVLEQQGILVAAPEMPWSRSRYLDKPFEAALDEIAGSVESLKQKGANQVVVGGHSMGAVGALAYAATRGGVAGLILLAPGHVTDLPGFHRDLGDSLAAAQEMVKAGRGAEPRGFLDKNVGRGVYTFSTQARIYVSYFSPEGLAAAGRNAAHLNPKIPVLFVLGEKDPLTLRDKEHIFARLPANPLTRLVTVSGGHMDVPWESREELLGWLKSLPQ